MRFEIMKVSWFYYIGRLFMLAALHLLTRWEVEGRENVPAAGPLIIIANHLNNADPPLVAVSVPRRMVFMAKEQLFRSKLSAYFVRGFGAFPIHRGRTDRAAVRQAEATLRAGTGLVMFPEGMRSLSGTMNRAYPGSALFAVKYNVPVLPVGITGTERLKGYSWILRRPRIAVKIGLPFTLDCEGRITGEKLAELTDEMMFHVSELLPERYRGYYTEKVKSPVTTHP